MAFYIGHGTQYESESDASSDFQEPYLDDDEEWDDPAGAFTRDTRVPIKQPAPLVSAEEKVPGSASPSSSNVPQSVQEPAKQHAVSTAPKPAHIRLMQVAPKTAPKAQTAKTSLYMNKHCM